jgi:hypothetical protein
MLRPVLGGRVEPGVVPPPAGLDPAPAAEPAPPIAPAHPEEELFFRAPPAVSRISSRGVLIFAVAMLLAAVAGLAYVIAE